MMTMEMDLHLLKVVRKTMETIPIVEASDNVGDMGPIHLWESGRSCNPVWCLWRTSGC